MLGGDQTDRKAPARHTESTSVEGGSPRLIPLRPIDATLLAPTQQGSVAQFGERPTATRPAD